MTNKQKVASWIAGAAVVITAGVFVTKSTSKEEYKKYYINPGSYNSFPVQPSAGDTVVLKSGNYGYINAANISGTEDKPINLVAEANVNMKNGIAFFDCKNWHIDGKSNLFIGNNPGTVAINIQGKSGGFEIDHIYFADVYSCIWFKTEPSLYKDTSYWHTLTMDGLFVHDITVHRAHFECFYIGSTDQKADRKCLANDGKYYYPLPAQVANIRFRNIVADSSDRTMFQASGVSGGKNFLKNSDFSVAGLSGEAFQGAIVRIGGNSNGFTVDSCNFSDSWLYAFQSQGHGVIKFTNNTVNNATRIGDKINPQKMAAVEFDGFEYPTTLKIKDNNIGYSNSGVAVIVTSLGKYLTDSCVFVRTNGLFQNQSGKIFRNDQ